MDGIKKKRLLVLGGQRKLVDIVEKARELGYYTVVTDWYEDSPAKDIADKAYNISTADEQAVLDLIRNENIDGVYTGFIDSVLPYYHSICKKAGLPCYLNAETLKCCTNKKHFKAKCAEYGIETIREYRMIASNLEKSIAKIEFPVLLKPVDNSGSKGITVCSDEWSFRKAYEKALRFSKSRDVIVEKFMCCDYIAAYYIVKDGECRLSMLADKDMNRIGRGTVPFPTAFVSPSIYYDRYVSEVNESVCRMINGIGYLNGVFQLSFFVSGHRFYAVELTCRLSATREYEFISRNTGFDILAEQIRAALSDAQHGEPLPDLCKLMNDSCNCMLFVFINEGIIGKIEGLSKIRNMRGVLNVLQLREEGASIRADGSYGQLFARIYLTAENKTGLSELAQAVMNTLCVFRICLFYSFDIFFLIKS